MGADGERVKGAFCLVLCAWCAALAAAPTGLSPSGGETVALLTDVQRTYLYEMGWSDRSKIMSKKATLKGFSGMTSDGGPSEDYRAMPCKCLVDGAAKDFFYNELKKRKEMENGNCW